MRKYTLLSLLVAIASVRILWHFHTFNRETQAYKAYPQRNEFYQLIVRSVNRALPSPHSELILGMTVGIDNLSDVKKFKQLLINTGTIHVVVVSGFNINLVFDFVKKTVGSMYRLRNLVVAFMVTLVYALAAGFEPPVARAWVMCVAANIGKYYGRTISPTQLLLFTVSIMLIINPELCESLSFQLSALSSYGLIGVNPLVEDVFRSIVGKKAISTQLMQDFVTTVSANLAVWPLISLNFGRISILALLVNPLVLWTVPIVTILGLLLMPLLFVGNLGTLVYGFVCFPLTDIFFRVVKVMGQWSEGINFEVTTSFVLIYYLIMGIVLYFTSVCRTASVKKENISRIY